VERLKSFSLFLAVSFTVLLSPWLVQLILCPANQIPTGLLLGGEDYWTFLVKMEWGRLGHWSYTNQLTPEATGPAPIYLFYLFLGYISKWTGISILWVFHAVRSIMGAVFLWVWWNFCRQHTKFPALTAVLGVFASAGAISLLPVENASYLDQFIQGHAIIGGLFGFTHYMLDGIAIILLLRAYLERNQVIIRSLCAGALLGMVHPFLLPLFPGIIFVHSLMKRDMLIAVKIGFWTAIGSLPFVVPMFLAYLSEPWLSTWREQTDSIFMWWENLCLLIATFGLAGIAAWLGIPKALKGDRLQQVSALWLIVAGILVFFAPLPNRREFAFFLSIPVGIIASPIFVDLSGRINTMKVNLVLIAAVTFSCITGAQTAAITWMPNSYIPKDMVAGLEWLKEQPEAVVACSPEVGLMIPFTGHRPWVAHSSETIDARNKIKQMREMFEGGELIPADYAVLTKKYDEKAPELKWEPVFTNSEITIWEIPKKG
jgi:hypothetical protein